MGKWGNREIGEFQLIPQHPNTQPLKPQHPNTPTPNTPTPSPKIPAKSTIGKLLNKYFAI
ncbi:MAG: hypothetical protein EWV84_06300 [Microcystis sp. M_QC_C_20170808_M3Col]|nr:MAG: hypothetical protein EWV84_06300 [Microcystis sp. M_QC_C_20170808_M3Col]